MSVHKSGHDHWSSNEIRAGMCPDGPWVQYADYQALATKLATSEERARMVLDAKNHWADRARASEAEVARLRAMIEAAPTLNIVETRYGLGSTYSTDYWNLPAGKYAVVCLPAPGVGGGGAA